MTSDVSDQATELEETMREEARARQQAAQAPLQLRSALFPNGADCTECGDPIPKERWEAVPGCARCISCERYIQARQRAQR
ncbi:MAG: TraR/DksA C4-type zinc finger protein [Pseudomonadota bacterium]|nr:TraR/DksA C4-type zinc finger protein [Pseudomonadota bacterium]